MLLAVAGIGCAGSAADHEALGDRAYVDARYDAALAEYRLALRQHAPSGRLRAKAAAAAMRTQEWKAAIEEYLALAGEDPDRAGEAIDGLEQVVRRALSANDRIVVRLAISGIRELAAHRAFGVFGGELAASLADGADPRAAVDVLPYAAAGAPDAGAQDSVMYEYGQALRRTGRCQPALAVFASLARRQRVASVSADAARAAAACALALGRRALDRSEPADAEQWFRQAVTHGGETTVGRAAYVGLGDVMFARGDFDRAVQAFQRAMAGAPPGDSIAAIARERLNIIGNAGTVFQ